MAESLFTFNLWEQNSKNGVGNQHRCTQSSIILFYKLTTVNILGYPLRGHFGLQSPLEAASLRTMQPQHNIPRSQYISQAWVFFGGGDLTNLLSSTYFAWQTLSGDQLHFTSFCNLCHSNLLLRNKPTYPFPCTFHYFIRSYAGFAADYLVHFIA